MSETESLLLRAKRLTAAARVKRKDAASIQAEGQFATALHKLTAQFPELETQLANRAALAAAGISVAAAPDLTKPAERLRRHVADIGRPTPQFMTSRSADLDRTITSLRNTTDETWRAWAEAQIATLIVDPDLLRGVGVRGNEVKAKIAELNGTAAKSFNTANLMLFRLWLDQAQDLIARLRAPVKADDVIARIESERGNLTFADLSDDEIDALRDSSMYARRVGLRVR